MYARIVLKVGQALDRVNPFPIANDELKSTVAYAIPRLRQPLNDSAFAVRRRPTVASVATSNTPGIRGPAAARSWAYLLNVDTSCIIEELLLITECSCDSE